MLYNAGMENTAVDRENTWLSIQDAARELGVNPRTIRRYIRLERLPVSRISNKVVRIRLADLDRLMNANVKDQQTPSEPAEQPRVVTSHVQPARPARASGFTPGKFS